MRAAAPRLLVHPQVPSVPRQMDLTRIQNLNLSYLSTFALRCAVDLDISGRIQAYGRPMPLNELARSIPIPPEKDSMLGRLMALLVNQGIFVQSEAGYQLTPASELLQTEGTNMGANVRLVTDEEVLKIWGRLSEVLKESSERSLFEKVFDGKKLWEFAKEKPEYGKLFDEAMASQSNSVMRGLIASYPHIFDGLNNLVDVGGGTGTAVKFIAEVFPRLRCTAFDLPHVVAKALKSESFDVAGGDMFEMIPPADAIFLKNVLHDWNDEDCVRILKRCKEAIESNNNGGKVIVVDIVIGFECNDPKATETSLLFDIAMMGLFGSKERNKQEWHDIIIRAGYFDYKIYPVQLGVYSVIELYP
ncbi:O-methyltransferase family protein [Rhynchospora pubera]|uniref:O-methyltransferase family protein n=1 Tax=Rhynchospora pubera TaxID=906938 RepID=A0AAV8GC02_9POAL|nr:O-methyltransferase family protein [Rhynchospora pubera]